MSMSKFLDTGRIKLPVLLNDGSNYHDWRLAVVSALFGFNSRLRKIVKGEEEEGEEKEEAEIAKAKKEDAKENRKLFSVIASCLETRLRSTLLSNLKLLGDGQKLWTLLQNRFQAAEKLIKKRKLMNLRQGRMSLDEYVSLFESLNSQVELFPTGSDEEKLAMVAGLNREYINAANLSKGLSDILKDLRMKIALAGKQDINDERSNVTLACFSCGKDGHMRNDCPKKTLK